VRGRGPGGARGEEEAGNESEGYKVVPNKNGDSARVVTAKGGRPLSQRGDSVSAVRGRMGGGPLRKKKVLREAPKETVQGPQQKKLLQ